MLNDVHTVEVEQEDFGDVNGFAGHATQPRIQRQRHALDNARIQPPLADDPVPA
jgi:hypothetical protein